MVVGIYCRFSKLIDDTQSKSSLQNQINNGKKFCEENGFEYRVYSENISGGKDMSDRIEGSKLLNDIEKGYLGGVWVDKEDRLYRNFEESVIFKVLLKKHNIRYWYDNKEYDFESDNDKIVNTILSLFGDIERKNILRRLKRGIVDRLSRGKGLGRIGYGFKKDKENDCWLVDEKVKNKIIKCYEVFVEKEWKELREWMYYCKHKLKVNKSTMWFYDLGRKRRYNGVYEITYNGVEYTQQIPKIVDDSLYKKFKEKFDKGFPISGNNRKHNFDNIYKGKIKCGVCNTNLNVNGKYYKKEYVRYLRCRVGLGMNENDLYVKDKKVKQHYSSINYKILNELVWGMLCHILFNSYTVKDEFRRRFGSGLDVDKILDEINDWNKQLKKLNKKEFELEERLLNGLISEENVIKHKDNIRVERLRIEGYVGSLEDDLVKYNQTDKIVKWIDKFKEEYSFENMMKKSEEERKPIILKYIDCVYFDGNKQNFNIQLKLNIPIIDDKLKFDKVEYKKFIKNGGNWRDYKKKFKVEKGKYVIKEKLGLNNQNFILNLHALGLWCNWQHVWFWSRRV